ncbi:MAG TPA: PAS domain-containing protein [Stenotrophomonas sp.]|nr:PAS domain-containing protein [Stenotrophomonas sp.]
MDGLPPALSERTIQDMLWKFALRSGEHAVMALDEHGEVTWANPGAEIILNASPGSLVGTNMSRFFLRRDIARGIPEHEREEALQRGTASDDRWMVRADRSRFWASGVTVYLGCEVQGCAFLKCSAT